MTVMPSLSAMGPLERLVVVRARSLARYAQRAQATSLEATFEIADPRTGRVVPVLLALYAPGVVTGRWFPESYGPSLEGRYPMAWLNELDFAEGDGFLPPVDLEDDGAPGTSRSPGAQHATTTRAGGEDPCQHTS